MISFAHRYQALLQVAQLLSILDRMIKRRLRESSDAELFSYERELWRRAREIAEPDKAKTVSLSRFADVLANHPFGSYLLNERLRRAAEQPEEVVDLQQIRDYLIHKSDRQKDSKRSLPVLPRGTK